VAAIIAIVLQRSVFSSSSYGTSERIETLCSLGRLHYSWAWDGRISREASRRDGRREMREGAFRHFDGAIKVYLKDRYAERMRAKLPHKDSYKKLKVFRIDGDINADVWINLTLLFFRGNELVLEYFDPN
jgi:hypothetical protein